MIWKFGTILQLTVYNVQLTIMVKYPVEAHGRVTENCELNIFRRTSVRLYRRNEKKKIKY